MWKLSITDDSGQQSVVTLEREVYVLGRAPDCDLELSERNVSRRHARLTQEGAKLFFEDLGSQNGSFLHGVRIQGKKELAHTDQLNIGDYRVDVVDDFLAEHERKHLHFGADGPVSSTRRLAHRLVVLMGPEPGREFSVDVGRVLIGRDNTCEVQLDHPSVSRVHAEVRRINEEHFEILDKGSANGLRLNSREISRAVLDGRDVIEVGDVVLKYIPAGQVFRISPDEGRRIAALSGDLPPEPSPRSSLTTILLAASVGALAAVLVALNWTNGPEKPAGALAAPPTALANAAQSSTSVTSNIAKSAGVSLEAGASAEEVLAAAQKLAQEGQIEKAHLLLERISETSPLLQDGRFLQIERDWAEARLRLSDMSRDLQVKRSLLDEVASSPHVPAEIRVRASGALSSMKSTGLKLEELPSSGKKTQK